jgi:hypothetical protein
MDGITNHCKKESGKLRVSNKILGVFARKRCFPEMETTVN